MVNKRRMLLLGGTSSAYEIRDFASANGITLIATGIYPDTLLKRISDESYDVDAVDVAGLVKLIKDKRIDAVFPGSNEAVVPAALAAARETGLPRYCNEEQWAVCMNKASFKELCQRNGIPTAKRFRPEDLEGEMRYPVVVKPADSCGSRGFAVCGSREEVERASENALKYSRSGSVIIEEYMPYDSVIIHYTLINGSVYFTGMSDKVSRRLGENGSSVMALQLFPSKQTDAYLDTLNERVAAMFRSIGMHDGPVWIEAFADNGKFWFNEMGYRFGGSMTYYPVRYFYGVDQLELMLRCSLEGRIDDPPVPSPASPGLRYCILPLHVGPCTIASVEGEEEVKAMPRVYAYVPLMGVGSEVKPTGTVDQVFCYLHVLFEDEIGLRDTLSDIISRLRVMDENGENRLFCLADISEIGQE